ncbi:hypothetical protein EVAR_69975_1 [Eumeta japonica]|uniref:Uncharacterized protein n=1 Tax=Eumeta variegata TaxID=151549 RepID=A0A4C1T573_EUMVA|nr:hypothetical protein EVAR_69975_1 [Eumeta japonica]
MRDDASPSGLNKDITAMRDSLFVDERPSSIISSGILKKFELKLSVSLRAAREIVAPFGYRPLLPFIKMFLARQRPQLSRVDQISFTLLIVIAGVWARQQVVVE